MSRVVILKLNGDLESKGFQVTLEISREGQYPAISEEGHLPANLELTEHLLRWKMDYARLTLASRSIKPYKIQVDGSIHPLLGSCTHSANQLTDAFQCWLRTESFRDLEMHLRRVLSPDDLIRILVRGNDIRLQSLPWHVWPLIDEYPHAEVALGAPRFQQDIETPAQIQSQTAKVTILAVLGDRHNIDIDTDTKLLNQLPGAKIELLVEPTPQQLNDKLYQQSWDIFFFAGHSTTEDSGQGILRLNESTTLSLDELKYGVKRAIANGLQLAIFNSCNGLGLAHAMAELQLSQLIVMREALPDHVAHEFLKYFLESFSSGRSLYQSARTARERLQGMEQDYPCASWLPVIYQHPAKTPPTWQSLRRPSRFLRSIASTAIPASTPSDLTWQQSLSRLAIASFMITTVVMGIRLFGGWQPLEFWAYDHVLRSRPAEVPDDRLLLITVDEADLRYQNEKGYIREGSLSNAALANVLERLAPHDPIAVGIDIIRDRSLMLNTKQPPSVVNARPGATNQINKLNWWEKTNAFFVCKIGTHPTEDPSIPPPPEVAVEQVGFLEIPRDPDHHIRRQFFAMSSSEGCPASRALSFELAYQYLAAQTDLKIDQEESTISLNNTSFHQLEKHQGAYHRFGAGGVNILLNYRQTDEIATTIPLRELLEGQWDERLPQLVSGRVVLIGTTARSYHDYHLTPLGELSGVEIHAHMISQVLSAVLDNRLLLSTPPQWGDALLILGWTFTIGSIAFLVISRVPPYFVAIALSAALVGVSVFSMREGLWIPLVPMAIAGSGICIAVQHSSFLMNTSPTTVTKRSFSKF
ncbi:MAG: CHASE2 domain-containing protein [Elainellaceae cyanobacterium]